MLEEEKLLLPSRAATNAEVDAATGAPGHIAAAAGPRQAKELFRAKAALELQLLLTEAGCWAASSAGVRTMRVSSFRIVGG
jgi:hypothetical protein